MVRTACAALLAASLAWALPLEARAASSFPGYVTLPDIPIDKRAVDTDEHGESEFVSRSAKERHRGRVWLGHLDYNARWKGDKRAALEGIVAALRKGGWEVMLLDAPANPPAATLKLTTKDNKVAWAKLEIYDTARLLVLEPTDD